jgi:hypothetical protein
VRRLQRRWMRFKRCLYFMFSNEGSRRMTDEQWWDNQW